MRYMKRIMLIAFLALFPRAFVAGEQASTQDDEGFSLIRISTGIVSQEMNGSLAGYYAIYVGPDAWDALLNDGDLGPLLKAAPPNAAQKAVILLPPNPRNGKTHCIYFDNAHPVGVVGVPSNAEGKLESAAIGSALRVVTAEMNQPCREELYFIPGMLEADDGRPVRALKIASAGQK